MSDLRALAEAKRQAEQAFDAAIRADRGRLVTELHDRRTSLGMTQDDVAQVVGCSRSQIANSESGKPNLGLSVEVLIAYAAAVGCRLTITEREDDE